MIIESTSNPLVFVLIVRFQLLFACLLERTIVVGEHGQESEREFECFIIQTPLGKKLGTTRIGTDSAMAVIDVDNGFFKRNKLIIVRGIG